jgi:GNAT superfamily N-acetyltransferase
MDADQLTLRFLLSDGEHMRTQVQEFPFAPEFASSSLLIVCANNDNRVAAACGIRGLLNTLVLYVREGYRNRGIGSQTLSQTIMAARRRKLDFVTLSVSNDNLVAFSLYKGFGFREVLSLKRSSQILMMLPLTGVGRLIFGTLGFVRPLVPNDLVFYAHRWLYGRTVSSLSAAS